MTEFTFTRAVRRQTWAVIGLAGPSGGGKTWTALELAMGLQGNGRTALISTEGSRDLYYADHFDFDRAGMTEPYTPARCLDALQAASASHSVVIFDSFSDEYIGAGGLVDMADAELKRMKNPNTAAAWAKPKAEHKKVIRWIRNSARCHLIFAMRAEEKVKLIKVRGETKVEPLGFQPICEKAFMFDMMESAMLLPDMRDKDGLVVLPDARGVPQWIKPMKDHLPFFPASKPITRESGRALAAWCAGGEPAPAPEPDPEPIGEDALALASAAAERGTVELRALWARLDRDQRAQVRDLIGSPDQPGELLALAMETDRQREMDADPFGLPPLPESAK